MPAEIKGLLGSPDASGALLPLKAATLLISPSDCRQLRVQYVGAGDFALVSANPALPVPYQFGLAASTDAAGQYDFMLPLAAEIHTPAPATFRWNITLPDGSVYTGPPLTTAGPFSLDDLIETYGWALSSSLDVRVGVLGQVALGTVTVTGQSQVQVGFLQPMADGLFQVVCSPGKDSGTGDVPSYDVLTRSAQGFTVELSFPLTGKLDYIAWHP